MSVLINKILVAISMVVGFVLLYFAPNELGALKALGLMLYAGVRMIMLEI